MKINLSDDELKKRLADYESELNLAKSEFEKWLNHMSELGIHPVVMSVIMLTAAEASEEYIAKMMKEVEKKK